MTQHCASLTHFAFGADLITQSDSIKYFIFDGTVAFMYTPNTLKIELVNLKKVLFKSF